MLTLLAKSKRTHTRYTTTHTKATAHKLRQATRRIVLSFSALAIACMPLLSLPANAQSSITGLSTTSGPSVGGTEVTFDGEVKASFKQVKSNPEASFTLALTNTGELYAWGSNTYGQLGDGTTIDKSVPVRVDTTGVLADKVVTQIAVGSYESYALTSEGKVYAWGENWGGALGDGTTTNSNTPVAVDTSGALAGKIVTQIAATQYSVIVLTSEGTLFGWGGNYNGELATGTTGGGPHNPRAVGASGALSGKIVTQIGAGLFHVFAITSSGELYAWGANSYGQLGDGTTTRRTTPTIVTALSGQTVTVVAGGDSHSLALTSTGAVYAWGWNGEGELGDGTTTNRTTPTPVDTTNVTVQTPTVTFGGLPATNVQIVDGLSGKELKATTPAHAPGAVDVVITFPGETPITLANAYTYLPTTTVGLSGVTHPDPNGIAPALASGSLLAAGACNNITEPSVALLSPTGASAPADVSLYGGVGFSLGCTSSGEAATVSVALTNDSSDATASLPAITSSNLANLRAYKSHSGTLTDITDQATFALGAGNTVLVSYQLVDGGELDEDGVANGTIVDPVYIGYYLGDDTSESGSLAETGSSTLLLATAGVVLVLGGAGGVYVATTRRRPQFSR